LVTNQLQVKRKTGKVRWLKTGVPPLCHATNRVKELTQTKEHHPQALSFLHQLLDC